MDQNSFNTLCLQQLKLSGVNESETVAILSQGNARRNYADAFLWAAAQLGASAYHLRIADVGPGDGSWAVGSSGLAQHPRVIEAFKEADILIDLKFLLFSKEQFAIQDAGTRVLTVVEPEDLLGRLMPTKELRERVEIGQEILAKATTMRITSEAGTDVTYQLGMYPTMTEYGYTDLPGRWDHWPAAFVFTGGTDDGVNGRIILSPGDVLLPFNTYVQTPVELTIEEGFVRDIRGALDAELLKSYIEQFNDPRGYGMSHVGWGLDHRAKWHGLTQFGGGMGMELRSFYGNVMFSIGPNNELGGPNDTPCHFDIPMRNNSLFLDGEPIVVRGEIVVPEMRAAGR